MSGGALLTHLQAAEESRSSRKNKYVENFRQLRQPLFLTVASFAYTAAVQRVSSAFSRYTSCRRCRQLKRMCFAKNAKIILPPRTLHCPFWLAIGTSPPQTRDTIVWKATALCMSGLICAMHSIHGSAISQNYVKASSLGMLLGTLARAVARNPQAALPHQVQIPRANDQTS